uniref:GRB10 interacting GYF protein 2 n=1 Tax=Pavo cristatus TaxID=9049 RepID=A0A8C9L6L6_PAVCR
MRKAISFFLKHQLCVLRLDCVDVFALLSGLHLFCLCPISRCEERLQQRGRCILLTSVFSAFSVFSRLRALSSGGSVTSPPLSPALPKYKLADYRYGREEMLALFVKDNKIPSDLLDKEFLPILQEEPLPPLALVPFTEEEQRNFSMSVNSAAVLRLTGRGGGTVVGAPRGRSSSRGRGRGRGESGFYQRSFDEVEGGFGRGGGREMHRSQSWEERGDRRFEKPGRKDPVRPNFEEGGTAATGRKHEFIRSESENWRIFREEQNGEDDDGGWRLAGSRRDGERWRPHSPDGPRSTGWREHMERRRRFEFDFRERDDERGYRRVRCGSGSMDDDRDSLPEWCLEDAEEEMGTFDSSGAFLSLKKVQKEPIPEEQEMDFRPVDEGEERSDSEGSHSEDAKDHEKTTKKEGEKTDRIVSEAAEEAVQTSSPATRSESPPKSQLQDSLQTSLFERKEESVPERTEKTEDKESRTENTPPAKLPNRGEDLASAAQPLPQISADTASPAHLSPPVSNSNPALRPVQAPVTAAPGMGNVPTDPDDEEGLKHLEQQAEKMVAYLQDSAVDDERLAAKIQEHRAKGSSMPLFHEAMQKWYYKDPQGEIQGPFSNQEMAEWFQAGYFTMSLLVKRACDETFQPLGDIMKMWGRVPFTSGPAPLPHLGELDQEHYQSQWSSNGCALLCIFKQNMMPPVTRSVSVPDTGSIWELQSASQPTVWEGSSVWDLPIDTAAQGPALEQLQQLEKAKAAKVRNYFTSCCCGRIRSFCCCCLQQQRRQQRELMKALQQQQQQQQQKLSGWGNVTKPTGTTKSLLEIQQEEARQMQKQQQQQHQQPNRVRNTTHSNLHTSIGNSVWGSLNTNPSNQWASDLVSSIWSNADTKNSNMGFWDDAVKEVGPRNSTNKNKSSASLSKSVGITSRQNKKVEEEEKLLKLFQGVNKAQDGFTQWCEQMLHALNTANNLDGKRWGGMRILHCGKTISSFFEDAACELETQDMKRLWQEGLWQKFNTTPFWLTGFSVNASSERLNMGEIETLEDY